MIQVEVQGLPALQQRLAQLLAQTTPAVSEGLYRAGNDIMGESVRLVPVDTGLLRSTAHVETPQQQGTRVVVQLSYGGHGIAEYAVRQHFDATLNHPNGGQAFYLQQPLYAAAATIAHHLATTLRTAWGRA